jgi:hypothetical protein
MGNLEVREKKRINPTLMHVVDLIIEMNLNSSQTKLVQSWGLGHSGLPGDALTTYTHWNPHTQKLLPEMRNIMLHYGNM